MKLIHKILKKTLSRYFYAKLYIKTGGLFQRDRMYNKLKLSKHSDVYILKSYKNCNELFFYNLHRITRYVRNDDIEYIKKKMIDKYINDNIKLDNKSVVIDVGANIGEFSLAIADKVGKIISVEPDPIAFKCLALNMHKYKNVNSVNHLLSNSNGTVDFYISSDTADSSMIEPDSYDSKIAIQSITLDDLMKKNSIENIDLLKIEAEGAEPEVLEGAKFTLSISKNVTVDCSKERHGEDTISQVSDILLKNSYNIIEYDHVIIGCK